ncbi:hypothetical protein NLJ89_g5337 [Agrocybe chaxingu]|uniref:Xylanolytic transcriptional activator regulatory domain-containing protein n=1 Tax=Agrocybe chaxingu TaxID=84603 RepID=A0A9W8K1B3_9AGAR|nr:hypothetical protein NLJ89_g5337 [Agrocybe chaxingu]
MGQNSQEENRRVPSKKYVANLEKRVKVLDTILQRLCPEGTRYEDWINALDEDGEDLLEPSQLSKPPKLTMTATPIDRLTTAIRTISLHNAPSWDDEVYALTGPQVLSSETDRFFGKSSGEMLARAALNLKNQYTGKTSSGVRPVLSQRREQFWNPRPWEIKPPISIPSRYSFPESDLAPTLVDLYFKNSNLYMPVLHQPSFRRSIREGLHFVDEGFASIYMLVCCIGARFSDDPRVRLEGSDKRNSSGWRWFDQVQTMRTSFPTPPTLYTIQDYCLTALFVHSTSTPLAIWSLVGIGIRLAQDVGAHRRQSKSKPPTIEHELWKRAFWILLILDRMCSAALGRPCAIFEEDYDLDLPIDCDDEYWEYTDPAKRFKQPPKKPSLAIAFIMQVKMMQVLTYCIRGIYSLRKTNARLGLSGEGWKARIVTELDSSLNKWFNSIPEHCEVFQSPPQNPAIDYPTVVTWDPDRENLDAFNLSTMLHASYYNVRILIHHSFIRPRGEPSPLPFPSLSICLNAARACAEVAYTQVQRNPKAPPLLVQPAVFSSALTLLFNLWSGKKTRDPLDENGDLAKLDKCIQVLKAAEDRGQPSSWFVSLANALCLSYLSRPTSSDVLRELAASRYDSPDNQTGRPGVKPPSEQRFPPSSRAGHPFRQYKGQLYQPMDIDEFDELFFGLQRRNRRSEDSEAEDTPVDSASLSEGLPSDLPLSEMFLVPDLGEITEERGALHRASAPDPENRPIDNLTAAEGSNYNSASSLSLDSSRMSTHTFADASRAATDERLFAAANLDLFGPQRQEHNERGQGHLKDATSMSTNVPTGFSSEDWAAFVAGMNYSSETWLGT